MEEEDYIGLELPFTKEEVKEMVLNCDRNKTLGPNDFSLDFFKKNWDLVKEDVLKFTADLLYKVILIKACTSSFITLIPKILSPQYLSEYKPIYLVRSLHKICPSYKLVDSKELLRN